MTGLFRKRQTQREDHGVYVPSMDGALRPNDYLDRAALIWSGEDIDDLAMLGNEIVFSNDNQLLAKSLNKKNARLIKQFEAKITALAVSNSGKIAVAVFNEGLWIGSADEQWSVTPLSDPFKNCVTAISFHGEKEVYCAIGSLSNQVMDWRRDLFEHGENGVILKLNISDGTVREIAKGLRYPTSIIVSESGNLIISEAWAHRVVELSPAGTILNTPLDNLPAYPGRISIGTDGGYLLSLFAPRRQFYELVLREDDFRTDMLANLPPDEWIGPTYGRPQSNNYPLLQGEVRQMGILKPWAPSSSYGLLLHCNSKFMPVESWHSRADGQRHGITAAIWAKDCVYVASKGSGSLLSIAHENAEAADSNE